MAGFPYLPLYWRDWLTGRATVLMTPEQKGAFVDLLCHAWESDPPCTLPDDDAALAKLSGLGSRWRRVGGPVRACFKPAGNGLIRNEKLWEVYCDLLARSERRRTAGAKGNAVRWGSQSDSQSDRNAIANPSPSVAVAVTEKEKPPLVPPSAAIAASKPKGKVASKGTRLPPGWEPNPTHRKLAVESGVDLNAELEKFRDHHTAKGTVFKDWDAGFRTWLRNAKEFKRTPKFTGTEAATARDRERRDEPTVQRVASATETMARISGEALVLDRERQNRERVEAWCKANPEPAAALWADVRQEIGDNPMLRTAKLAERAAEAEMRRRVLNLLDSEAA